MDKQSRWHHFHNLFYSLLFCWNYIVIIYDTIKNTWKNNIEWTVVIENYRKPVKKKKKAAFKIIFIQYDTCNKNLNVNVLF
jgi:hypothetical protein